jgi:hypothetical protein
MTYNDPTTIYNDPTMTYNDPTMIYNDPTTIYIATLQRLKAMLHGAIFLATCNAIILLRDVN